MASSDEYTWIVLFSLLGIVCIISNGLVCYVIIKRRTAIGVLNNLVLSLALTDILIGSVCVPMFVTLQATFSANSSIQSASNASLQSNYTSATTSPVSSTRWRVYISLNCIEVYLSSCSILHLCVMAFDRVLLVTKPLLHRGRWMTINVRLRMCMIPWVLAAVFATATIIHYTLPGVLGDVVTVLGVFVLLPCVFIVACYVIILISIRRRNKKFSSSPARRPDNLVLDNPRSSDAGTTAMKVKDKDFANGPQPSNVKVKKIDEIKMIKTLFCIIVVFMICWLPLIVMNIVFPGFSTLKQASSDITTKLGTASKFFHYCNSACNPFIYSFFNQGFRASIVDIFKNRFRNLQK